MKQYGRTLNLKNDPAIVERYVEHHRSVWPEVERGLRAIGITQMRIWRLGRRLFMLMETVDDFDPERDFARYMESDPRIREWQSLMETFQEPVPEAKPGEWWADMDLVYALEEKSVGIQTTTD
ncbi:MAG TPA: L-rhamnose mutarotase [Candidatus Kryptonia bacterium]|nr:L-rhamnose mutarotase [Candidatus Kryptonia bacterium]